MTKSSLFLILSIMLSFNFELLAKTQKSTSLSKTQKRPATSASLIYGRNWEEKLTTQVRENPKSLRPLVSLSQAYFLDGQVKEAEKMINRAIKLDSKNPKARRVRAEILLKRGKFKKAVKDYEVAEGSFQKDPQFILSMGKAYYMTGKKEKAETYFQKAYGMPTQAPLKFQLALFFEQNKLYPEAKRLYQDILLKRPELALPHYHLGKMAWEGGAKKEAKAYFDRFMKLTQSTKAPKIHELRKEVDNLSRGLL